jgi:hypothetical protein
VGKDIVSAVRRPHWLEKAQELDHNRSIQFQNTCGALWSFRILAVMFEKVLQILTSLEDDRLLLPNHPRRKEIVHPVLFVAFLAQMSRELGPVPDAVQQRMNKDLAAAGGEFAG